MKNSQGIRPNWRNRGQEKKRFSFERAFKFTAKRERNIKATTQSAFHVSRCLIHLFCLFLLQCRSANKIVPRTVRFCLYRIPFLSQIMNEFANICIDKVFCRSSILCHFFRNLFCMQEQHAFVFYERRANWYYSSSGCRLQFASAEWQSMFLICRRAWHSARPTLSICGVKHFFFISLCLCFRIAFWYRSTSFICEHTALTTVGQ